MTVDLNELEALAKAATPGWWVAGWENDWKGTAAVLVALDGDHVDSTVTGNIDRHDAKFIAAAQPMAILELIAVLREALS